MSRSTLTILPFVALLLLLTTHPSTPARAQAVDTAQVVPAASSLVIPAHAALQVAIIRPVWAKTAKPGDPLYLQTVYPFRLGDSIAIPAGTYVRGHIDAVTRPTRRLNRAELRLSLDLVSLVNGYTIALASPASGATDGSTKLTIQVSTANDLLLDNGAQFEVTLPSLLTLDSRRVAQAISLSRTPPPGLFKSATLCRPTAGFAGTPGSPDTVIPGSSGTPSTTIPGMNGSPDITIPGTPATPATVIPGAPGTPGSPGSFCPAPPLVLSSISAPALDTSASIK